LREELRLLSFEIASVSRLAIHQHRQKYGIPAIMDKNGDRNEKVLSMIKKVCLL
jgi:hypothetical protein